MHRPGDGAGRGLSSNGPAFLLLRDLIARRTGVFYDDQKYDLLESRVDELMDARGIPSLLDYYYLLRYDPDSEAAWTELVDRLAVPETYFWRQPEQFEALADVVLPRLLEAPLGRPLRIWSAACCSGEEPLSIAMLLDERGWLDRVPIEIVGSDASQALVARARAGLYGERALRNLSPERRERYFHREGDVWRIDPTLHARVSWTTANLLDEAEAGPLAEADVIFCRNVFIYFSDDAIQKVVRTFGEHMPAWGYLFLGASESLMRLSTDFVMEEVGSAFAYRRCAGTQPGPTDAGASRRHIPSTSRRS
jgi:chemotaxis protein methyltransferase CheR